MTREADLNFYQGYPFLRNLNRAPCDTNQPSEQATNAYNDLNRVMHKACDLYFAIADLLAFDEIKPNATIVPHEEKYGKLSFLFGYVCNSIAETNRLLLNGERRMNSTSERFIRLSKEALHFARLAKDFWKDNSTYHRNFGCIAESINNVGDMSNNDEIFCAYKKAIDLDVDEWNNYKTILSYADKWINRHIGTLDPSTGFLSKDHITLIADKNAPNNAQYYEAVLWVENHIADATNRSDECEKMKEALRILKQYSTLATRMFPHNYESYV